MACRRMLLHPATRGLDLDDPRTTIHRREIIRKRKFLRHVYREWYGRLVAALPPGDGPVVELGSGPGFLAEVVTGAITSDVLPLPGVRALMDGCALPFADGTLRAILMTNVFHHLPSVKAFLREAARSLRSGGVVAMVEPWLTRWSSYVYTHWHHEPFDPDVRWLELATAHPLSSANGALAWIVFERDRAAFGTEFPLLGVRSIEPLMPFSYLLSGGFSAPSIAPAWSFRFWRRVEQAVRPLERGLAMFAVIVLERSSQARDSDHRNP